MTAQEALAKATEALLKATQADDRIKGHERLCTWRWGILIKLLGSTLAGVVAIAGILAYDKLL